MWHPRKDKAVKTEKRSVIAMDGNRGPDYTQRAGKIWGHDEIVLYVDYGAGYLNEWICQKL